MNAPNTITVTRIFLIFVFMFLASVGDINDVSRDSYAYWCHFAGYFIGLFAGCTDFVDGWLARKLNLVSDFGALMDPLADKIFVAATYVMMVHAKTVPAVIVIIIISREFMVTGLRQLAAKKGTVIAADNLGKIKTILQMVVIAFAGMLWINLFGLSLEGLEAYPVLNYLWKGALWGVALITVWSGLGYFVRYKDLYLKDA